MKDEAQLAKSFGSKWSERPPIERHPSRRKTCLALGHFELGDIRNVLDRRGLALPPVRLSLLQRAPARDVRECRTHHTEGRQTR